MKRDMDLIRAIMLAVEAEPAAKMRGQPAVEGYTAYHIAEHVRLLIDAEMMAGRSVSHMKGVGYIGLSLTWAGYEFLEKVRDPEVWAKTKAGAAKVGAWSVATIGEIAAGVIKARIAALLGMPDL